MPITVCYNNDRNVPCTLRPAPFISINTELAKTGAGEMLGVTYSITLRGTLLADRGSPFGAKALNGEPFSVQDENGSVYVPTVGTSSPGAAGRYGPMNLFFSGSNFGINGPPPQIIENDYALDSMFSKQQAIRELFARDGQLMEITPIHGDAGSLWCNPTVTSITFTDGVYVDKCDYTITLSADTLRSGDWNGDVHREGLAKYVKDGSIDASSALDGTVLSSGTEAEFLADNGVFISDFSESWSLEADETGAETLDGGYLKPRTYKISHSMSATGKTHYTPEGKKLRACDQAKKFVHDTLDLAPNNDKIFNYPNSQNTSLNPDGDPTSYSNRLPTAIGGLIGSGTLDLISKYGGFNRLVSEDIDETNGSYSINETWLLASGTAYETYNMTVNSSMDSPFREVSINGTITGLSSVSPSGFGGSVESAGYPRDYGTKTRTSATPTDRFGDLPDRHPRSPRDADGTYLNTAYDNAISKWKAVSGNEVLGIGSEIYKRANYQITNDLDGYRKLNPQYMSVSLATNEVDGTISYNVTYNNRPLNVLSGVLYENISISDTNPGDVFSVIPVIGRRTGPVLQYIGGRTEYKRDVSIEVLVSREDRFWGDPTYDNISNVGTGFGVYSSANPHLGNYLNANLTATGRALLPAKPSIVEPTRTQLQQLLMELSPVSEPGIRKYFVNAPTESWDPKEGRYTLNVSWTYELEV